MIKLYCGICLNFFDFSLDNIDVYLDSPDEFGIINYELHARCFKCGNEISIGKEKNNSIIEK